MITIAILLGLAASWVMTGGARRFALKTDLLDHPNDRSSHAVPTPRGGGVAIVVAFTALVAGLFSLGRIPLGFASALLAGGLAIAVVGYLDDRLSLPARWRFLVHLAAAAWILVAMHGIPPVPIFGFSVDLGWFGLGLAALYVVWMVNLCNFMDGIDGIASLEAISVSLGGALCWWLASDTPLWFIPVLFAACVAGFLIWNYPPAKIFMGDSGSGFIGFVLALLSLWTAQDTPRVFWCWFILLGGFMVDATTTLVRRVRRGERFNEAHRSHAYQYAARRHRSHERVTLAFVAINLLWLLPIALLVAWGTVDGVAATIVAYAPLVWLAFRYKAGARAEQDA
jgi:Fuc2NAc and GlcNAc transferase